MKLKKLASIMGLSLGLGILAAPAYSGSHYFFEDDSLEWALRPDGAGGYTEITSGNLSVGDVLYTVFEMPTFEINGVNAIPAGQELTGVSAIEVKSAPTNPGDSYVFQPWGGLGYGTGSMVAMFLNDLTTNVDLIGTNSTQLSCTTLAGCRAQVTAGTKFQVDGFTGDLDEFWTGLATTTDLGVIKAGSSTKPFVVFDAALGNIFNAWGGVGYIHPTTGIECADTTGGCVQFLVSGSVYGGGGLGDTNIIARDDFQAQKYVPEPASLALLGIGLAGMGAARRRQG